MRVYFGWWVFSALLLCVITVASGAQSNTTEQNSARNGTRNESKAEESKWQTVKNEFQLVWGKLQYFFTNDVPHFFSKDIPDNEPQVKSFVENEIENVKNTVKAEIGITRFEDSCQCIQYNCGCCQHLEEPTIHLNSTICANVTYLSQDIGISLTVTVNDYAIFNETVSVRNPPPVCLGVPYVKEWAEACVRFHDIDATRTHFHACAEVEARMKHILIAKYELGCFDIGPIKLNSHSEMEHLHSNEQPSVMLV